MTGSSTTRRGYGHKVTTILVAGALIRFLLVKSVFSPSTLHQLSERIEISTPVASWKRLREGIFLLDSGRDPYKGGVFFQSPLLLFLFGKISDGFAVDLLFLLVDVLSAYLIARLATYRNAQEAKVKPWMAAALTIFHPLSIASSLGRCPTSFSSLCILLALVFAAETRISLSMGALAIATHLGLYPMLLLPACVLLAAESRPSGKRIAITAVTLFVATFGAIAALARVWLGSWSFLQFFTVILAVQDLSPNVGIHWYFFIEMFDHFRPFFLGAFQLYLVSFAAPLYIKLRQTPLLAATILCGVIATFKSYPSIQDLAFFHSMLAVFPDLVQHMRYPLLSTSVIIYCLVLLPSFHHLWLYAGSGNSNFFYAGTLVWTLGNGFLIADTLYAQLKQSFLNSANIKDSSHIAIFQR